MRLKLHRRVSPPAQFNRYFLLSWYGAITAPVV